MSAHRGRERQASGPRPSAETPGEMRGFEATRGSHVQLRERSGEGPLIPLPVLQDVVLRLVIALAFGALIGLERSYHGRPAGFRTHALVCLASTSLMLVPVFESQWFSGDMGSTRVALDPTRMAQGIMTGIGFLGAGVIMKDGLSVRGLTTAASIWITSGIGVLVGIGFYIPALLTTAFTFGALGGFRWIERRMKTESYAHFSIRFPPEHHVSHAEVISFVAKHGFSTADVTHWFRHIDGMEYRMVVHSLDPTAVRRLSESLRQRDDVAEFRISPTGD
jgi:putative Mg2+ transporter-C (MgtC) family protein